MKRLVTLGLLIAALGLGGCAQRQQTSMRSHGKEYFPESKYGRASPRVVAEGEEVPKGGGQYLVGKPYSVAGHTYVPSERKFAGTGLASWYGDAFHGRRTANGEVYDKDSVSGAHPTMPLPSYARVTNLRNHHSIIVRVNDRGPYHDGRIMDLSSRAAEALGYRHIGTARVKVEYVGNASLGGSDDNKLLATLRVDGRPAQLDDFSLSPTMVAERRELPEERPAPTQAVRDIERVAMIQPESAPQAPPRTDYVAVNQPPPPKRPAPAPPLKPEELAPATGPVAQLPEHPPAPPQRPFDLGTIPGADTPIRVSRR
ncbi:septal ring lytic transglycosylase RlpA family protein [Rhodoblastus acidophilus]|uniref:Endolytic peptidoglycan transglycosylase RlpA n=1 Tax=Rhodoblastus acidophilus TaxID=1074 RepID=A0A6N8DJE2_RHOAC|nr:septal ring lytic transglycosylase RlpA family protein [Rhodoblastus acidophilus]MCW2273495.1 rare lipoprotein A [Rhodoblastus acidophilus]MTV30418.1 septal ring lytic transglycosylase RlpA family protein [Rhodoblastus acidophilus]